MKNLKSLLPLLALLCALSTQLEAGKGTPVTRSLDIMVLEEVVVIDFTDLRVDELGQPYFPLTVRAVEIGTHFGLTTRSAEGAFYFLTGRVVSEGIYTVANGDEIHVSFIAENIELGIETGINTVVGGTGRFADATGEWSSDTPESEESESFFSPTGQLTSIVITRSGFVRGSITY